MDLGMFGDGKTGELVPISGADPVRGPWQHSAFLPDPLPEQSPDLTGATYRIVANARAALATLDSTARQLPNSRLLRRPTLRHEAQSTSALEGTYEPLERVLVAADDPAEPRMREVINYELMAEHAFLAVETQRPVSVPMLCELQKTLVTGTPHERAASGRVRSTQVVVGRRSHVPESEFAVVAARFVPPPPGLDLEARLRDLVDWLRVDRTADFDPLVASALVHYQFETLHPFHDGNGRLGRLLIVLQLYLTGTLSEPTLTVSPWFESRRNEYQDRLLAVSTRGDWDGWTAFFASGLAESATATRRQMLALVQVQAELKEIVRTSKLRADTAHALIDFAVSQVAFTVREVERGLHISYGRANQLVDSLVTLGILKPLSGETYNRRFYAPRVLSVLLETGP